MVLSSNASSNSIIPGECGKLLMDSVFLSKSVFPCVLGKRSCVPSLMLPASVQLSDGSLIHRLLSHACHACTVHPWRHWMPTDPSRPFSEPQQHLTCRPGVSKRLAFLHSLPVYSPSAHRWRSSTNFQCIPAPPEVWFPSLIWFLLEGDQQPAARNFPSRGFAPKYVVSALMHQLAPGDRIP